MRRALLASLLVACGTSRTAQRARPTLPAEAPSATESWTWTQSHVQSDHIRIELENWQLHTDKAGVVSGWLIRENRFLSSDGEPFACIQGLSYSRRARYRLRGTRTRHGLFLEETQVRAVPSPCEDGVRPLQKYEGQMEAGGKLHLRWPGGEQLLLPVPNTASLEEAAVHVPSLDGTWSWTARELENSLERTESEHWQFEEGPDEQVRARYRREVLVVDKSGGAIACAGSDRYGYEDTYELRGTRNKNTLHLQEMSVQAASHACIDSQRVLDGAVVTMYPESMVLEWRGRRVQVLKLSRRAR